MPGLHSLCITHEPPTMTQSEGKWLGPFTVDGLQAAALRQVPVVEGVYLWVRGLQLDPECAIDPTLFAATIEAMVRLPYIQSNELQLRTIPNARRITIRHRLVNLGDLTVGGGRLSQAKSEHLQRVSAKPDERLTLFRLLTESIGRFGPVLYVGEAQDLRQRIRSHITAGTQLLELARTTGIAQEHLLLYCLPLPNLSEQTRTLVEQVITHILVAPLTRRPG